MLSNCIVRSYFLEVYLLWCKENQEKSYTERMSFPVVWQWHMETFGQMGLAGLSQRPAGTRHTRPSHTRHPGDSPAGQDPDHVAGLVPFNTDCTVVKVGLCFLQHRKHTWAYFRSFNSCKDTQITRQRTMPQGQASMVLGSVFLINNLLFTGLSFHSF